MQLLIDYKAPINIGTKVDKMATNGWSPLHMAVVRNDPKAVHLLLKNSARIDLKTCVDDYNTAEEEARRCNYSEIVALIQANSF